jgi:hypothetical protein
VEATTREHAAQKGGEDAQVKQAPPIHGVEAVMRRGAGPTTG